MQSRMSGVATMNLTGIAVAHSHCSRHRSVMVGLVVGAMLAVATLLLAPCGLAASLTPWGPIPVGSSPGYVAVDTRTGHAFVTNYLDDSVSVFDTRRGIAVGTVRVGHAPSAVAVDART